MSIIILIVLLIIAIVYIYWRHHEHAVDKSLEPMYDLKRDVKSMQGDDVLRKSIEVPIKEAYLPHEVDIGTTELDSIYNYRIIMIFKEVLERQPRVIELKRTRMKFLTGEQDEDFLRIILFNSVEYMNIMDMQSNSVQTQLEHSVMKKKLYDIITALYKQHVKTDVVPDMLSTLRDVMIHLRFDLYLFVAVLKDNKYKQFEEDILGEIVLTKYVVYEIFYRHFDIMALKRTAELIKEEDLKDGRSSLLDSVFSVEYLEKRRKDEEDRLREEAKRKIKEYANNKRCNFEKKKLYDPIDHKKPYKSNWANRPPICTTLGQDNKVYPATHGDTWTSLEESKKTGMGSIMPKFEFREYVRVKKNQ